MVSNYEMTSSHVPVIIIGGGITGLSAALFLQQQGIKSLLVERQRGTSTLPKARTIDIRTMELFRELGLSDDLREAGKALAPAWGILRGATLTEALQEKKSSDTDKITFPSQMDSLKELDAKSPVSGCRCTQDLSEAVLHKAAIGRGCNLKFYHQLVDFKQDRQQVTATVQNRETEKEQRVTADYVIAADGANSRSRKALNVPTSGKGDMGHFLNIYFKADLAELVKGQEFSQFLIAELELTGFLLSINNADKWAFHLRYDPDKGKKAADFSDSELHNILQTAIGIPDLDIEILKISPWELTVRIAEQLTHGRIFLAGDAAHTMTPYAGKGANAGVQDVHNLAWKLAAVMNNQAHPKILTTYNTERQPVGAFYGHLSAEMADDNGLIKEDELMKQGPTLIGLPDYIYRSKAIISKYERNDDITLWEGEAGTRMPHLWLDESTQKSTLDWLKNDFIIVATNSISYWNKISALALKQLKLPVQVHHFDDQKKATSWEKITQTQADEALLIRPDGFVAMRASSLDAKKSILNNLRRLLCF